MISHKGKALPSSKQILDAPYVHMDDCIYPNETKYKVKMTTVLYCADKFSSLHSDPNVQTHFSGLQSAHCVIN